MWVLPVPLGPSAMTLSRRPTYSPRASSRTSILFKAARAAKSKLSRFFTVGKRASRIRRSMWNELYDKPAPAFSRANVISRLTFRLQELHAGGLKPATRARLDALADGPDPK